MASRRGGYGFSFNLTGPGTIFTIAIITLAIGFAVLFTRGVVPQNMLSDPGQTGDLEVIDDPAGPGRDNLQLRTIRFRECGSKVAVGLLVDRSGSMDGEKMGALQNALRTFTDGLSDESVIGLVSFSSNELAIAVTEDVPIDKYSNNKAIFPRAISNLSASGSTNTRTAMTFVRDKLFEAQAKFPTQEFALIVMSDGIPELYPPDCASGRSYTRPGGQQRCFSLSQDPTQAPDISQQIKDRGIKIYSIALYDPNEPSDVYFLPDMRRMMGQMATLPTDSTFYELPDPSQLTQIYKDISQKICNDVK